MATIGDLIVNVGANIAGFKTAMGDVSSTATSTAATASTAASKINQVFSAAFGAGIGTMAFSAANKFESAFVQIQRSTGATEEKLKGLEDSFKAVYTQTAASSQDVAAALSILSTRTGSTGKDLEDLTLKTIKLAKTQREDLNTIVPLVTRAFGDWSIASQNQGKAMDYLRTVSQQTGTSVARLAEQVVYAGAPLRQLGYNFEQSAALIGKFEKEGVNTELVLGGMKAALQKFAKDGVTDTATAWREFVEGVRSGNITLQEVMTQVGAKRGVDLYRAITEGRFEIDEMVKSSKRLAEEGGASMETFKTKITKITHEIEAVVAGHSQLIMAIGFGMPIITAMGGTFKTVGVAAVGAISNIVTAIRLEMIPALTAVEASLLGITLALPALIAGYMAWVNIQKEYKPDSSKPGSVFDTSGGYTFSGFGLTRTPQTKIPNAADYVKSLPAPKDLGQAPAPGAKLGGTTDGSASHQFTIAASIAYDQLQESVSRAKKALEEFFGVAGGNVPVLFASEMERAGKSVSFISQILTPSIDTLRELPVEMTAAGSVAHSQFTPEVLDAANAILLSARNAEITTQAYHEMGLKTPEEFKAIAKAAHDNYEIIKGEAGESAAATQIAWTKATLAQIELDYQLGDVDEELYVQRKKNAEDALATLEGKSKETTQRIRRDYYDLGNELEQMSRRTFDSLERDLAKDIVQWKGWSDTIKNLGNTLATDFTEIMLKGLFKPLEDQFAKLAGKIGGWLSGIFGGGGSAAGSVASSAGGAVASGAGGAASAAGSAVGAGLAGTLNAVFSGISAATGVFSIFQGMHQETSLNAIEHNTRYLEIIFQKFAEQDEWQRHESLFQKLDDMWNEIRNVVSAVRDFQPAAVPAATPGNITINVYGTDVNETVNRITRHLKARGVYV